MDYVQVANKNQVHAAYKLRHINIEARMDCTRRLVVVGYSNLKGTFDNESRRYVYILPS
jgi:hypothetical protein